MVTTDLYRIANTLRNPNTDDAKWFCRWMINHPRGWLIQENVRSPLDCVVWC